MSSLKKLEDELSTWPEVSVHPHRFGGKEFRFRSAEIGHVHLNGVVDIPFPRAIRDVLLEEGLAQEHRWVPNSGWVNFRLRNEDDLKHALSLMRMSYLRYALKTATDAEKFLEGETKALGLTPRYKALLERFMPTKTEQQVA